MAQQKLTGIPWLDNLINGAENVASAAGKDVSSGASAVMNYINQPKSNPKTNGAISSNPIVQQATAPIVQRAQQTGQNLASSPLGQVLSGNFSNVVPTFTSNVNNTAHQVATGNMSPFMGMMGVDAPMEAPESFPSDVAEVGGRSYSPVAQQAEYTRTGNPNAFPPGSPAFAKAAQEQAEKAGLSVSSQPQPVASKGPNALQTILGINPNASLGGKIAGGIIRGGEVLGGGALLLNQAGLNPLSAIDYLGHNNFMNMLSGKPINSASPGGITAANWKPYTALDPYNSLGIPSDQSYGQQAAILNQKIGAETSTNPIQANADKGSLAALQDKYQSSAQIRNLWSNSNKNGVSDLLTDINTVGGAAQGFTPDFWNTLDKGYSALQNSSNPQWAQVGVSLENLSRHTGVDYTKFTQASAIQASLNQSAKTLTNSWKNEMANYQGQGGATSSIPQGPAVSNQSSAPATSQAPQAPFTPPPGWSMSGY